MSQTRERRAEILRDKLDRIESMKPEEHKRELIKLTRVMAAYDTVANNLDGPRLVEFAQDVNDAVKMLREDCP